MKNIGLWVLFLPIFFGIGVQSYNKDLEMTVLYDRTQGLKPGNKVYLQDKAIGIVKAVKVDTKGLFKVSLQIEKDFRQMVTDHCRFIIQDDLQWPEDRSVGIICMAEGGKPLSDGAMVKGSTSFAVLLEEGGREFEAWSKRLREEMDRWEKNLRHLPEKEWYKRLEREMKYWARELEHVGEKTRRHFIEKVLPTLEEAIRELKRHFEEKGREEDVRPLERKLEEFKTI